jgi:Protein of unknown function (DUF3160)
MKLVLFLTWALACSQLAAEDTGKYQLTADEEAQLQRDKVLITRQEVNQCFTAYLSDSYPRFITSDAVLNAYHVLFEETLRGQEELQARHLRSLSKDLWLLLASVERMYKGDQRTIIHAKERAQLVIGVASSLFGDDLGDCGSEMKHKITQAVADIKKAMGQGKPSCLGPPEPDFIGFDYTLFRPLGFYLGNERLRNYFQATRWFQMVPFRLNRDEELLAWHMLQMLFDSPSPWLSAKKNPKFLPIGLTLPMHQELEHSRRQREIFTRSMGLSTSNPDLSKNAISSSEEEPILVNEAFFRNQRSQTAGLQSKSLYQGNDRIRTTTPSATGIEARAFSAFNLPEDGAFTFLGQTRYKSSSKGMAFNAWLGVPLAEKIIGKDLVEGLLPLRPQLREDDEKLKALPWWKRLNFGSNNVLLCQYAALRFLEETSPQAPDFMRGEVWQKKTLQTIASSWAQTRHAWVLQAKPEIHVIGAAPLESGFVEPFPEFFQQMAQVAQLMGDAAFEAEISNDPIASVTADIQNDAQWMRELMKEDSSANAISAAISVGLRTADSFGAEIELKDIDNATKEDVMKLAASLEKFAQTLHTSATPGSRLWEKAQSKTIHPTRLWHRLQLLCLKLAALAKKQLSRTPLNEEDAYLVKGIGYDLSEIMMYRGQAMIFPIDDAPRITRLSSDPKTGEFIHVAIGRPRIMFVLYPWEGREILCRGVVMPYHEVHETTPIDDEEWQKRQEKETREGIPEWLKSVVPDEKIQHQTER